MQTSEQINELAAAVAEGQGGMGGAVKDSSNPFFKSKYADLESVWNACRKALSENGLAVIQTESATEGGVLVSTMLTHSSGQWVRDHLQLLPKDMSPQGIGSAITYGRRYALASIVGVYQTDDDGEAAHGRTSAPDTRDRTPSPSLEEKQATAKKLRDAHDSGIDANMLAAHTEANKNQELYDAAWYLLPAHVGSRLKLGIERAKCAAEGREYVAPQPRGAAQANG